MCRSESDIRLRQTDCRGSFAGYCCRRFSFTFRSVTMWVRCMRSESTHRQTWLSGSTSTYPSTDLLTARGVAHLVVHRTSGSSRPATTRFHPNDWRPLEACCRPWTRWCNDAMTALAGYATVMMMMMMINQSINQST